MNPFGVPAGEGLTELSADLMASRSTLTRARHNRTFCRRSLLRHLRSSGTTAGPLGHGPYQRAKQRLTVAIAFLAWLPARI